MFLTKLILTDWLPGEWVLMALLVWHKGKSITVPTGFITNLASIPRLLRALLNVNGKSRKPAVLHDFLYCSKLFSRSVADRIFYDALVAEGMNKALARLYWAGVRSGGWLYYGQRSGLTRDDFDTDGSFEMAKSIVESFKKEIE